MKTKINVLLMFLFGAVLLANAEIVWQKKANRPRAGSCDAVTYKGKIYVSSINSNNQITIEEYDPATDKWSIKNGKSNYPNAGVYNMVSTDDGIYFLGGFWNNAPSNKMEKYNVEKDKFEATLAYVPTGFDCASAVSVNNRIYIMCGSSEKMDTMFTNKLYEYDIAARKWTKKQDTPHYLREAKAIAVQNKIYLIGGSGDFQVQGKRYHQRSFDIYDPATDTWSSSKNDIVASDLYIAGVEAIQDDIFFITWRSIEDTQQEIFKYNVVSGDISKVSVRQNAIGHMGIATINNSIYLIGGHKGSFNSPINQNVNEMFTYTSTTGIGFLPEDGSKIPATIRYNPGTGRIEVSCDKQFPQESLVTVVGMDGKIKYSNNHLNLYPKAEIPTDKFPSGIYIVSIYSEQAFKSEKIILD